MDIVDEEVQKVIARQEKQLVLEMGELYKRKYELINEQGAIQYAKKIARKLDINYGSALCIVNWLEELLEIYPQDKSEADISANKRQRLIHLGRLIKIAGGQKGLIFCCSKLPEYAVKNFNSLLDWDDSWKNNKVNRTVIY